MLITISCTFKAVQLAFCQPIYFNQSKRVHKINNRSTKCFFYNDLIANLIKFLYLFLIIYRLQLKFNYFYPKQYYYCMNEMIIFITIQEIIDFQVSLIFLLLLLLLVRFLIFSIIIFIIITSFPHQFIIYLFIIPQSYYFVPIGIFLKANFAYFSYQRKTSVFLELK